MFIIFHSIAITKILVFFSEIIELNANMCKISLIDVDGECKENKKSKTVNISVVYDITFPLEFARDNNDKL